MEVKNTDMTAQQIQDGNRLIAEFMGGKYHELENIFSDPIKVMWFLPGNNPNPHCTSGTYKRLTELEYNVRWDWLMRACKRFDGFTLKDFKTSSQWTNYKILCDNIDDAVTTYDIEKAFSALVKGIEWYKHFGQ